LPAVLRYGHTVSGDLSIAQGEAALKAFTAHLPVPLKITSASSNGPTNGPAANRNSPNYRWLVKYALGSMDTDALSSLVWGELYIPVTPNSTTGTPFLRRWLFPANIFVAVQAYACVFAKPFWANYTIENNQRKGLLDGLEVTETLTAQTDTKYTYTIAGIPGFPHTTAEFGVSLVQIPGSSEQQTQLQWSINGEGVPDDKYIIRLLVLATNFATLVESKLASHFGPTYFDD